MASLIIHRIAEEVLEDLSRKNHKTYLHICRALNELEQYGLRAKNIKQIRASHKIFRKRTGRYRILFTVDGVVFHIWIIDMKKDRRDYIRWIMYIHMRM